LDGSILIQCPEIYELNLKTKKREKVSGCGKLFAYGTANRVKWDAEKFIAYDNNDCYRKLLRMPRNSPLVLDEAFNFMSAMDHNKIESKELKKLFTVIRPRRLFIMANVPHIRWIDSKYREEMSHFWFQCLDRGYAVCYERDKGISKDVWHLKEVEKHMGIVKYFSSLEKIKNKLKKTPTYFDTFTFPALPQKVYDQYELVRNAHNLQRQLEEQDFSTQDIAKVITWNIMFNWDRIYMEVVKSKGNKMTYGILRDNIVIDPRSKKTMVSETTLRNWIRGVDSYIQSEGNDMTFMEKKSLIKDR